MYWFIFVQHTLFLWNCNQIEESNWNHDLFYSLDNPEKRWLLIEADKVIESFPGGSDDKESTCNVGDQGLIPVLGKYSEEENGYLLQYSYLEKFSDRGTWWAIVYGVSKSWTPIKPPIHQFLNRSVLSVLCASYLWYLNQQISGEMGTSVSLLVGHSRGRFKISGKHCLTFGIFPLYRLCLLIPSFPSTAMLDPGCSLESPEKGASLAFQWLILHLSMPGVQVPSMVGELRFHMPFSQKNQNLK